MGLGMLLWVLVLGGVVVLAVWLVRTNIRPGDRRPDSVDALEILRQRYARGEVTREQFERMKQDLGA